MDPNATLEWMLELAEEIRLRGNLMAEADESGNVERYAELTGYQLQAAADLSELVEDLHRWILRGGVLPKDWRRS